MQDGLIMTGGGSLIYGLDKLIADITGIKTRVAQDPVSCVAIGTGQALEQLYSIEEGVINLSRSRSQRL
jgi:rod shape-determining protein MreB